MSFIDRAEVQLSSGHGGHGSVHFSRTRKLPRAGPDGGNGGKGGDVILSPQSSIRDFSHLKTNSYKAEDGKPGQANKKNGASGSPLTIPVPEETFCYTHAGVFLKELSKDYLILKGGIGGKGNTFFKSAWRQAPRKSQLGTSGKTQNIILEMKWKSDFALLGVRGSGKTSFLFKLSDKLQKANLRPTINPQRYAIKLTSIDVPIMFVDLPGISLRQKNYLRQTERSKKLLFFLSSMFYELDPLQQYHFLILKLKKYDQNNKTNLLNKPRLLFLDAPNKKEIQKNIKVFQDHNIRVSILPVNKDSKMLKKFLNLKKSYE